MSDDINKDFDRMVLGLVNKVRPTLPAYNPKRPSKHRNAKQTKARKRKKNRLQ